MRPEMQHFHGLKSAIDGNKGLYDWPHPQYRSGRAVMLSAFPWIPE